MQPCSQAVRRVQRWVVHAAERAARAAAQNATAAPLLPPLFAPASDPMGAEGEDEALVARLELLCACCHGCATAPYPLRPHRCTLATASLLLPSSVKPFAPLHS